MQNVDKKTLRGAYRNTEYTWRYSLMDPKGRGRVNSKNGCKKVSHELRDQHNICVQPNGV